MEIVAVSKVNAHLDKFYYWNIDTNNPHRFQYKILTELEANQYIREVEPVPSQFRYGFKNLLQTILNWSIDVKRK